MLRRKVTHVEVSWHRPCLLGARLSLEQGCLWSWSAQGREARPEGCPPSGDLVYVQQLWFLGLFCY